MKKAKIEIMKTNLKSVPGFLVKNGQDDFTIVLNDQKNDIENCATFLHECLHIYQGDPDSEGKSVSDIEKETHNKLQKIAKLWLDQ